MKKLLFFIIFINILFTTFSQIPSENLILWLKTDSVEITDNVVSIWYDQSGNEFDLTQETANRRPVKIDNVLNGLPAIRFDGVNDFMRVEFGETFTQPNTIFCIYNFTGTGVRYQVDGTTEYHALMYWTNSVRMRSAAANWGYNKSAPFDYILVSGEYNTNQSKIYENGVFKNTGNMGTASLSGLTLGSSYNTAANTFHNGDILEIIIYDALLSDEERISVEQYLMNKYSPILSIGEDIIIEYGFCPTELTVESSFTDILWSTGETTNSINISESGTYFVQAIDFFGRLQFDTIEISYPEVYLPDTLICLGDSVLYSIDFGDSYTYLWSTESVEPDVYIYDEDTYWIQITDSFACSITKYFTVSIDSFSSFISLGNDTSLCAGNTIGLIEGEDLCTSFFWTVSGNSNPYEAVFETGWQIIVVENENNCIAKDSIFVTIIGEAPNPNFTIENICLNEITVFTDNSTPQDEISSWRWIINGLDTVHTQNFEWQFHEAGQQFVQLIVESEDGCANDTIIYFSTEDYARLDIITEPICTNVEANLTGVVELPENAEVSYFRWYLEGEEIGSNESLNYTFNTEGIFDISFEAGLGNSCVTVTSTHIDVRSFYPIPENIYLRSPEDKILFSGGNIVFRWNSDPYAIAYHIQVSLDDEFQNLLSDEFVNEENFSLYISESFDTLYWKVFGINPCLEVFQTETRKIVYFHPSDIGNMELWIKSDSLEVVDGRIASWYDLSENEYHLTQTEATRRPALIPNSLNTYPAVRFDGVNDNLQVEFNHTYNQPNTVFCLYNFNGTGVRYIYDGITSFHALMFWNTGIRMRSPSANFGYSIEPPYGYLLNTNVYNNTDSKIYENGILKNTGNMSGATLEGLTLGSLYTGNSSYHQGDIIELIYFDNVLSETERNKVEKYFRDKYFPPVDLGNDIRIAYGFCDTIISAYQQWFVSYEWNTGSTDSIIVVNTPGTYTVTVTDNFGIESTSSVRVFYPNVNQLTDTILCLGYNLIWDLELNGEYIYDWIGLESDAQQVVLSTEGSYAAIITDTLGCKFYTDTIDFSYDYYETSASLGPSDTTLCAGNRLMLISNSEETIIYNWSTGSSSPEIVLEETGEYLLTVTNWRGCVANLEIFVNISGTVPTPAFNTLGHCEKNVVYFNDISSSTDGEIVEWNWYINNEQFANTQSPSLVIDFSGVYEVTLEVVTDADCKDFVTKEIKIYPLPEPDFSPDYFCANNEAEFSLNSSISEGEIISHLWDFGDFVSSEDNPIYFFENEGDFLIRLTAVSDQQCVDSLLKYIEIRNSPLPTFSFSEPCVGETVYFINNTEIGNINPARIWQWNFGDDHTSDFSNPEHTYIQPGEYDVSLRIKYLNGCSSSNSEQLIVHSNPVANVTNLNACLNQIYSPQDNSNSEDGDIILWNWVINEVRYTEEVPEIIFTEIGQYPLSLEVISEYGCRNVIDTFLLVRENPVSDFSASRVWGGVPLVVDFFNNSENSESWHWFFGDGEESFARNPSHVFMDSGNYIVQLISFSEFLCPDTSVIEIRAIIPKMDILLYDLQAKMNGNFMELSIFIINNGSLPASEMELFVNLGNAEVYRAIIGHLNPGQVLFYDFGTQIYRASGMLPEIICVEIDVPPFEGIFNDENIENNRICQINSEGLKVFPPYPNPASNKIFLAFSSDVESTIILEVRNSTGNLIYIKTFADFFGYKSLEIDMQTQSAGIYFVKVYNEKVERSFKFLKSNF